MAPNQQTTAAPQARSSKVNNAAGASATAFANVMMSRQAWSSLQSLKKMKGIHHLRLHFGRR